MDAQIDPKLLRSINTTKKLLGKHVSKPVLADKYLGRPPFRFLLEIVNNVIQQTGFMQDAFSSKELNYDEIASAEEKRAVLKKVIEAVENETGEKCTARASKILSGKEPEKTNEMLQLLAKAITSFSRKPKPRSEKSSSKILEKTTTFGGATEDDGCKASVEVSNFNTDDNKQEVGKDQRQDLKQETKSKKSRHSTGTPAPPVTKKPSVTSSSNDVKSRSSADRINLQVKPKSSSAVIKKSVSSSSTKVPSKETLKTKVGSPSPSSLALTQPKRTSSINLTKSQSRQSLGVKSSSSSTKVAILSEPVKASTNQEEENLKQSKSIDKLHQKSGDGPLPVANTTAMPPETPADVPLQRPVTRTKYRQKTNEGEAIDSTVSEEVLEEPTPLKEPTLSKAMEKENLHMLEHEKKDSGGGASGFRSGRSSSSEDVVTEHMNEKISEWRVTSAEVIQQSQPEAVVSQCFHKSGWITDEPEQAPEVLLANKLPMNRVFESVENFTAEKGNTGGEGQSDTVVTTSQLATSTIIKDDRSMKALKRPVTVLRDNESGDEEDDTFLVQEKIESERDLTLERLQQSAILMNAAGCSSSSPLLDMNYLPPEQRGLLVNQILETQRELEKVSDGHRHHGSNAHHQGSVLENELAERDKAAVREVYLKQIEDLKEAIQKMSKCANPLANIIQRSQDDACLMEIEFRKLRQENERLQRKIDGTKEETSKILYPLTEELTQLDSRIEKVEGAIVLAKQRLSLIDSEYTGEFISQIENTPTEDEAQAVRLESDPIWQFRGNFTGHDDDDKIISGGIKNKSLIDVFQRAVNMHEGSSWSDVDRKISRDNFHTAVANPSSSSKKLTLRAPTLAKNERRLLNRTVYGDDSPLGLRSNRILRQLEQEEPPFDKENKPSWWD